VGAIGSGPGHPDRQAPWHADAVSETVIELDPHTPWEPSAATPRRVGPRVRWVAVAAVLAVTLGMLVASAPRSGADLLYSHDNQVLRVLAVGGRLYLTRYQDTASGQMIEARRLSDGRLLWERPAKVDQRLASADDGVVVLVNETRTDDRVSTALTVLDAATGTELWSRSRVTVWGTTADALIVEEEQDGPDDEVTGVVDQDPGATPSGLRREQRFLGLSNRTGSTTWTITVPQGSAVSFHRRTDTAGRLAHLDVVDGAGRFTRWDTATGTVTETRKLDWSGTVAGFYAGWIEATGRPADQVVVYPAGQRDAVVLDARTGRALFRWPLEIGPGLFQCTETLFCTSSDDGLRAVDSATGEIRWHIKGSDTVIAFPADRLLVGSFFNRSTAEPEDHALVDSRTGALVKDLAGWHVLRSAGERLLMWRTADQGTALLGELDPRTGLITVHANAADWAGDPDCSVDGTILGCVVVGGRLSAWRLPKRI
jgi:hypothetical protein